MCDPQSRPRFDRRAGVRRLAGRGGSVSVTVRSGSAPRGLPIRRGREPEITNPLPYKGTRHLPLSKVAPTPVIVKPPTHALLWDCSVRDKSADLRFPPVLVGNTWQLSPLNLPPGSIFDFFR